MISKFKSWKGIFCSSSISLSQKTRKTHFKQAINYRYHQRHLPCHLSIKYDNLQLTKKKVNLGGLAKCKSPIRSFARFLSRKSEESSKSSINGFDDPSSEQVSKAKPSSAHFPAWLGWISVERRKRRSCHF